MDVKTLGIDLGKNVFHVVGLEERGAIVLNPHFPDDRVAR